MILARELKIILKSTIYSDKKKSISTKWKQSLLAIVFALALTSVLILIKGSNPIQVFMDIFNGATRNQESLNQMLLYFSMFVLSGLAIIVGFKSGLFNIGIGGQMLISGAAMMIIAVKTSLPWPLILILGMLISAVAASISGVLKSLFNIHEVVSTILINWIFFWVSQYLLRSDQSWTDSYGTTKELAENSRMMIGGSVVLPAIIVTSVLLILALILFNFTKFGYALKAVGKNPDASKYAAIKITFQLAFGMALSGLAVGALAGVNYLGKFGTMSFSTSQSLPGIGFQGISVALISFNSLLGLIPAALFWAIITSGADYASIVHPDISKEVLSLMNGFVIYMIAISIIFIRFRPIKTCWLLYIKMTSKEIKQERQKYKTAKLSEKKLFKSQYNILKNSSDDLLKNQLQEIFKKEKDINKELSIQKRKFILKNKKPIKMFNKNYEKQTQDYNQKYYENLIDIYDRLDNIVIEKNKLISNMKDKKIKENNKELKRGLEIIRDEYAKRIENIQNKYRENSFYFKWLKKYHNQKLKNDHFREEYTLLKIDYINKVKLEKNSLKQKNHNIKRISNNDDSEYKKIKELYLKNKKMIKENFISKVSKVENKIYKEGGAS